MKNKRFLFMIIFLTALLLTAGYIIFQNSKIDAPTNANVITVTEIKRVDFDTFIDSNIVWIPGEENSVAALYSHMERNNTTEFTYHQETSVNAYNLETGEISEVYNLWDYKINKGNGRNFFWSQDGSRLVTDIGGVVDLKANKGYWLNLPTNFSFLDVYSLSPDSKKVFAAGGGKNTSDSFIIDLDNGEYEKFKVNLNVFSPPLLPAPWDVTFYPLSWSPNGLWFAVETYDPEHPPKSFTDVVPSALYLLSIDGDEARLVARNIEGRIDSVAFSPDGSKLVWVETRKNYDQFLYIANIDGSGIHEIFSNANLPPEYNITSNILWSPDGNRLVYIGYHGNEFIYPFWVLTLGDEEPMTPIQ